MSDSMDKPTAGTPEERVCIYCGYHDGSMTLMKCPSCKGVDFRAVRMAASAERRVAPRLTIQQVRDIWHQSQTDRGAINIITLTFKLNDLLAAAPAEQQSLRAALEAKVKEWRENAYELTSSAAHSEGPRAARRVLHGCADALEQLLGGAK
jgi:hypothetical protein